MTTYAVTGATGRFGRHAIQALRQLAPDADIVALARNLDKAKRVLPAGVTVRPGDYDNLAQLRESLSGVDRLLFISSLPGGPVPRATQHQHVVDAAKDAGVSFIAYTSFPHANDNPMPLAADHKLTEAMITAAGLDHSFLRNNWYLENDTAAIQAAAAGQPILHAVGDVHIGWALEAEYAEAAARVLVSEAPRAVYEFAGPMRRYADLAAALGHAGTMALTPDALKAELMAQGVAPSAAAGIAGMQAAIATGGLDEKTDDLPEVLGRALTPLPEAMAQVMAEAKTH